MQSFQNLELLHNELNTSLQNLVTDIGHSNNQTKLFRLGYNVNTIIESYLKIDELRDKYKNNLRPFQSLISKYVKKIHVLKHVFYAIKLTLCLDAIVQHHDGLLVLLTLCA